MKINRCKYKGEGYQLCAIIRQNPQWQLKGQVQEKSCSFLAQNLWFIYNKKLQSIEVWASFPFFFLNKNKIFLLFWQSPFCWFWKLYRLYIFPFTHRKKFLPVNCVWFVKGMENLQGWEVFIQSTYFKKQTIEPLNCINRKPIMLYKYV